MLSVLQRRAAIPLDLPGGLDPCHTAIAGAGIHADEVLHRARVHPSHPAAGLSQAETRRLHTAIHDIRARR